MLGAMVSSANPTNLETTGNVHKLCFKGWFAKNQSNYNQFMKVLLSDDIDAGNYYMNQIIMTTFSYFDVGQNELEQILSWICSGTHCGID